LLYLKAFVQQKNKTSFH